MPNGLRFTFWMAVCSAVFMPGCGCDTVHFHSKIRVSNASDSPAHVFVMVRLYPQDISLTAIALEKATIPQPFSPHLADEWPIPQVDLNFDSSQMTVTGKLTCQLFVEFGGDTHLSQEFTVKNGSFQGVTDVSKDFRINIEPAGNVNFYEVASAKTESHPPSGGILVPIRIVVTDTAQAVRKSLPNALLP